MAAASMASSSRPPSMAFDRPRRSSSASSSSGRGSSRFLALQRSESGGEGRRFSRDFTTFQGFVNPNVSMPATSQLTNGVKNLKELMDATAELLEVARMFNQTDRIDVLEDFQKQLQAVPGQVAAALGRSVPSEEIGLQMLKAHIPKAGSSSSVDSAEEAEQSSSSSEGEEEEEEKSESCPICYDDFGISDMRTLFGCGQHRYCHECMSQHLSTLINDSQLSSISCPYPGCSVVPAEYELENLVSEETYGRYLQFAAAASLQSEQGTKWCPSCHEAIIWDPSQKKVVCPGCKHEFCFDCSKALHEGRGCNDAPADAADEAFQQWLREKGVRVKPCPNCREGIEKNEGCNHMTCGQCQHQWCWLCLGDYVGGHFTTGLCSGLQFAAYDSLAEARGITDEDAKTQLEEQRTRLAEERAERERYEASPEYRRAMKKRRRKRRIKKVAKHTALTPFYVVVGVTVVAGLVIASPFLIGAAVVAS